MRVALNSDFQDYYDHCFEAPHLTQAQVWERYAAGNMARADLFAYLERLGLRTPLHGSTYQVAARVLGNDPSRIRESRMKDMELVVYTDPYSHQQGRQDQDDLGRSAAMLSGPPGLRSHCGKCRWPGREPALSAHRSASVLAALYLGQRLALQRGRSEHRGAARGSALAASLLRWRRHCRCLPSTLFALGAAGGCTRWTSMPLPDWPGLGSSSIFRHRRSTTKLPAPWTGRWRWRPNPDGPAPRP